MEQMKTLQQKVDATIRSLGGYFRSLFSWSRTPDRSEIGEVGEALEQNDLGHLRFELVDVLMISTRLANQYVTFYHSMRHSVQQTTIKTVHLSTCT